MAKDANISVEGKVTKVLKGTNFEVTLDNGFVVKCTLSGKLRLNKIKIINNDDVVVQLSPYDLTRGIIIWRGKLENN